MSFDFSSAVAAAQEVVNQSESSGNNGSYNYPLVYPQKGQTLTVRLLFNPKSSQIVRLVNRHEKTACLRTYGIECPICKMMQQVKDMTGQDPFGRTKSSRSRGVAFAQYISSSTPIDKGNNRGNIQPGEFILFMFPWSVYQQINAIIQAVAQTPTGMDQAFSHAQTGLFINVTVTNEFKYTTTQVPYMTFQTNQSDDDFMKMLEGMESLNEQVLPSTITEEVDKQVREYADAIYRQYVAPRVPNQGQTPQISNFNQSVPNNPAQGQSVPNPGMTSQPNYPPQGSTGQPQGFYSAGQYMPNQPMTDPYQGMTMPQATGNGVPASAVGVADPNAKPVCFGHHEANSPKCIVCPCEVMCMQPTDDTMPF